MCDLQYSLWESYHPIQLCQDDDSDSFSRAKESIKFYYYAIGRVFDVSQKSLQAIK